MQDDEKVVDEAHIVILSCEFPAGGGCVCREVSLSSIAVGN